MNQDPPLSAPKPNRIPLRVLLILIAVAASAYLLRSRIHFDWSVFFAHLRHASMIHIMAAGALILSTNWLRSWRWTVFLRPVLRPDQCIPRFSLAGTQFMGFAAVALFGRIADLTRPYLVSRQTGVPLATQIAIYTVERIFDLGAVAILFSTMLFFTPADAPHYHLLVRSGLLSFAATIFLLVFAVSVRFAGDSLAAATYRVFGQRLGDRIVTKLLSFRDGLHTLGSGSDLLLSLTVSLAMWFLIAEAYVQSTQAFPLVPALASLSLPLIMPLLAASMGGSLLQLPILGWFTQIAITATAMHTLYGAPIEDATACGAVLLIVNTLIVIPVGLAYTRAAKLNLRTVSVSSSSS